jgi:serine/threonine protein kinase
LKPSTVLLDAARRPRISDFVSSRDLTLNQVLTGGEQVGTRFCMALKLYEKQNDDKTIDIYSFALILYEIVVGLSVSVELCRKVAARSQQMLKDLSQISSDMDSRQTLRRDLRMRKSTTF